MASVRDVISGSLTHIMKIRYFAEQTFITEGQTGGFIAVNLRN